MIPETPSLALLFILLAGTANRYTASIPGHCNILPDGKYSSLPIYIWAISSNLISGRLSPN